MLIPWLRFARDVVEAVARGAASDRATPPPVAAPPCFGVFVTLRRLGRLRGCIGSLEAESPFAERVRSAAAAAATRDPRFPPVTVAELPDLRIELSVLETPTRIHTLEEIHLGVHGVLVRADDKRGIFLPSVALDHGLSREDYVSRCCAEKAGLDPDAWRDGSVEMFVFTTRSAREDV